MYKKDIMKATKFGLSVFTGKNYFLIEFAALSKNAIDKMSEVFVNKTLVKIIFLLNLQHYPKMYLTKCPKYL